VFELLFNHARAVLEWSERARSEVEGWSDVTPDGKAERALERIRTLAAEDPR